MRIEVLGSFGGENVDCRMTCLLINERVALDAGSLSRALPISRQVDVDSIVLTHSHMDHTNSLPFFIENVYGRTDGPIEVYTSEATSYAIRKYLFNNATWPDFTRLPNHLLPAVEFRQIDDEIPFELGGVRFTPIPVDHLVPTHGFLIEDDDAAVIWSSDTGPTRRIWEIANQTRRLKAVCVECSFDNSLQEIADISQHLTPRTLDRELEKLEADVPILLHHLKPPCLEAIRRQISALPRPELDYLQQGEIYDF